MKLVDKKVTDFLSELACKTPAPGGGSVSALSGSLASSLVLMAGSLTVNKKKFRNLSTEIQTEYNKVIEYFSNSLTTFTKLVDEDTLAFNGLMEAYKLPKETENEIIERNKAIETATIGCIKTPMETASLSKHCLKRMSFIVKYSNLNTLSDQGVAVLEFYTAFKGAAMNVLTNLTQLTDQDLVKEYNTLITNMISKVEHLKNTLLEEIESLLS